MLRGWCSGSVMRKQRSFSCASRPPLIITRCAPTRESTRTCTKPRIQSGASSVVLYGLSRARMHSPFYFAYLPNKLLRQVFLSILYLRSVTM